MLKTILVVTVLAIVCSIGSVTMLASSRTANAQDATVTPTSDLGLDASAILGLIGPEPRISWRATTGVDHFHLTATLQAVRVNRADPSCSAPAQAETRTVSVDETLPGEATDFTVSFPPLTGGDGWFVFNAQVRLDAVNGTGGQIGSQGGGGVVEATCGRSQPTTTSATSPGLPSTGTGPARDGELASIITAALALLLLLVGSISLRVFRR